MPATDVRHLGILLFDGMEELDAVGPWEVLAWWTQRFPQDGWSATTASRDGRPVTSAKGLVITPHVAVAELPALDVLIHPGGGGTRALCADAAHLEWLREQRERAELLVSVCTGSIVLAAAGLLAGRPATTYHGDLDELAATDPTVDVRRGERFVDDGDVITAAGVSAGIDAALHLVARLAGPARSREVREGIEYAPDPPV